MKLLVKGDQVYFVKPGCLAGAQVPIERVVFDREEDGMAFVTDSAGSHWDIPMGFVCGVPEGHVFAADLGTTSTPNPCLVCGCEVIVSYRGSGNAEEDRDA
jgi:hypothetical protein